MIFCSHAIKTHFSRKFLHFASFWKWEFLKLENGLLSDNDIVIGFWMFQKVRTQSVSFYPHVITVREYY